MVINVDSLCGIRSPDGRFREYKYNREISRAVVEHLQLRGYDAQLLVPEEEDGYSRLGVKLIGAESLQSDYLFIVIQFCYLCIFCLDIMKHQWIN